ncbi:hypothetical protein QE152_g1292 [Popillia japonica]|uniref:Uncharacterized protein n=1 Tax=Popillia japonica TaxID=7064 RepID=A0AAW1N394_POPJA
MSRISEYLDSLENKTIHVEELKIRQQKLDPLFEQFEQIQDQIEDLTEIEPDSVERSEFENKYFQLCGNFAHLIKVNYDSDPKPTAILSPNDSHSLRLSRVEIPEFSVLTADIAKMYRQVLISDDDRKFQRILWRNDPSQPIQTFELSTVTYGTASASFLAIRCLHIQTFELSTVTYGTASASFLAIRCLHQLANEDGFDLPTGSKITLQDFYVDDLITGADTIEEGTRIVNEATTPLRRGGFELRKWCSNNAEVFNTTHNTLDSDSIRSLDKENAKILGLLWNSTKDSLLYSTPDITIPELLT